jgi:hypothetical protein
VLKSESQDINKADTKVLNTARLNILQLRDKIKMSDEAYHLFRKEANLKEDLPAIGGVKALRIKVNEIVAEVLAIKSQDNRTGATVAIEKVVSLIKRLHPDLKALKVTWDERLNGGMYLFISNFYSFSYHRSQSNLHGHCANPGLQGRDEAAQPGQLLSCSALHRQRIIR